MTTPSMMERYTDRADAFDGLFNMVLGYGIQFLLPCIIGVIAAILFFMVTRQRYIQKSSVQFP